MALDAGLRCLMNQSIVVIPPSTSPGAASIWGTPTYAASTAGGTTYACRYTPKVGMRYLNTQDSIRYVGMAWVDSTGGIDIGDKVILPGSTGFQPVLWVESFYDDDGTMHHQKIFLSRG